MAPSSGRAPPPPRRQPGARILARHLAPVDLCSFRVPPQRARALMGKRKVKAAAGGDFWSAVGGWKEVPTGDDFLLGAEEDGFGGLEVLEGAALGGPPPPRDRPLLPPAARTALAASPPRL
jgi:hypothetical protein